MTDSFDVTTAALHGHAGGISGLAEELRGALATAGHVTLTADAYGQTCARAASMLNAVAEAAGTVVQAGIDALASAATDLRGSAVAYADTDTGSAGGLSGIGTELA